MGFVNINTLIIASLILLVFLLFLVKMRKSFSSQVKSYWKLKFSKLSKLSFIFYVAGSIALIVSLGDLRGPEEIVNSNIPNQRTLILIDNSMSMLVEDVRPNRISKAAILAKHFVKNSYGHQVSLSIFSDIQKKIVPFTDDMDILESRLGTMLNSAPAGGSNLGLALKESFQYFRNSDGFTKGNVLLITDGEEHESFNVEIPEEISLAIVGVGTESGGKIPQRNKRGNFVRYKKHNGIEIVSKLDKAFFTELVEDAKYAKVWFVESYSLPTEEILSFFKSVHLNSFSKGSFRMRPVYGYWIIALGVMLYILSVVFSRFRTYTSVIIVLFALVLPFSSRAQDAPEEQEVEDPMKSGLVEKFRSGNISKNEKLKLAEIFLKEKEGATQASQLYDELLDDYQSEDVEDLFNYATSLLKEKKLTDSVNLYKYILDNRETSDELKDAIKEQIKFILKEQKKDKKKSGDKGKDSKNQDKKSKDKKENKDQNKNNKKQQDQKQSKDQKSDQKDKKNNKDQGKKDKNQQSDKQKKKEKNKKQQWKSIEDQAKKKKNMKKANGVFKQIMNDDAQLQKKFLDTSLDEKNNLKDW